MPVIAGNKDSGASSDVKRLESNHGLWLTTMLPDHFRGIDQFAPHHDQYWNHVWNLPVDKVPSAALAPWNRKGMKSTGGEATCPALSALGKRQFGLYISGTQDKADAHLESIKDMLLGSEIPKYYPKLSKPKVIKVDQRTIPGAWNHAELQTESLILMAVGLDKSIRGLKKGNQRPDFMVLDDIEDEDDSMLIVQKKIDRLSMAILPSGSQNCAIFFVQNLIHRDSVISQCLDGRADILRNRIVCGGAPIPALYDDEYETSGSGLDRRHTIVKGTPSWVGFGLEQCQAELDLVGLRAWQMEYQHRVNTPYENAIFPGFDEIYHVITWDEFAPLFEPHGSYDRKGVPRIPTRGYCGVSFDQGTTIAHPSVVLWDWQPSAEMPCKSDLFFYRELCRPHFPRIDEDEIVVPEEVGMAIQDLEREWNDNVKFRQGSHEAKAVRNSFGFFLGKIPGYKNMDFDAIETQLKKVGIVGVQDLLAIDHSAYHPFRLDPRTRNTAKDSYVSFHQCHICKKYHDGEHLRGKPGVFFVVAKGQGELYEDSQTGELKVMPAIGEAGFARTRWEFPRYRHRKTAGGVEGQEAPKIDDDAMDVMIAATAQRLMKPQDMTEDQRLESMIPEKHRLETISQRPGAESEAVTMGRYYALATARHELEKKAQEKLGFRQRGKVKHSRRRF